MKKNKRGVAILLSFVLLVATIFAGNVTQTFAASQAEVKIKFDIANPPDNLNMGLEYDFYNDTERLSGERVSYDPQKNNQFLTGSIDLPDDATKVVFKLQLAGANVVEIRGRFGEEQSAEFSSENIAALTGESGYEIPVTRINGRVEMEILLSFGNNGGQNPPGPEGPGGPEGSNFSGNAYVVWEGANDALCRCEVTNLKGLTEDENGKRFYPMNYISAADVKDEVTQQTIEGAHNLYWVWADKISEMEEYTSWSAFDDALREDEDLRRSIAIDPCGAENGNNSLCTNGNQEFRAIIYGEEYAAVQFSDSEEDYTYFPEFWDPVFFSSTLDVSGTTKENPAVYESFLLEPSLHLQLADIPQKMELVSLEALEVPAGAVDVTINEDGTCDIQFHSNFYDKVIFELKTADNTYYFKVARIAISVTDNFGPEQENPQLIASLFYDEKESYENYEMLVNVFYEDGTVEMKQVPVGYIVDIIDGVTTDREKEAGKGLKKACYPVDCPNTVVGMSYTVIKSGALEGNSYGGTFCGSGSGTYYDIETRRVIY